MTTPPRPPVAWLARGAVSAVVATALIVVSGRYGYHRDELYFLRAGEHSAFGYLDQPSLTPLLARGASELFGDSLVGVRLASALAAGLVVLLTGLIVREFGGGRGPQALAAGCVAVSSILLMGHLLSTSTFDLLVWTALSWLVVRALRDGGRGWLAVGLVAGIGLQNKTLVASGDHRRRPRPPRSSSATTAPGSNSGSALARRRPGSTTASVWTATSRTRPSGSAVTASLRGHSSGRSCAASADREERANVGSARQDDTGDEASVVSAGQREDVERADSAAGVHQHVVDRHDWRDQRVALLIIEIPRLGGPGGCRTRK